MDHPVSSARNRAFIVGGLAVSLVMAVGLSPFASQHPDGLDRVAQDLQFEQKAAEHAPATKLPFYHLFDEYAVRGVPGQIATPLAGLAGTLVTFGVAFGLGKLMVPRSPAPVHEMQDMPDASQVDE